jgi:hypothetical protein
MPKQYSKRLPTERDVRSSVQRGYANYMDPIKTRIRATFQTVEDARLPTLKMDQKKKPRGY